MKCGLTLLNSVVVAGILSLMLCGCAKSRMTGASPADEQTIRSVRELLKESDPKAAVGVVIAVLPNGDYAAVGDIAVQEFKEGEPITFIDSNRQPLANGIVKAITSDALHVQIVDSLVPERKVRKGDLAVRFKP